MANTNVQAVAFCNGRIRPAADTLYGTYLTCKKLLDDYSNQGISAVIPNDATLVADGSATDGRPPMTNAQAITIVTRAQEFVTWAEGTGALAQVAGRLGTIAAVEVNGRAAF